MSLLFKTHFVTSTLLYFGAPIAYLVWRSRARMQWRRIAATSIIFGILYGFLFDYIAELGLAWAWPQESYISTHAVILGTVNVAALLWVFLWVTLIVLFYEHFVEHDMRDVVSKHVHYAVYPALCMLVLVIASHFFLPAVFKWQYAYFVLALLTILPAIVLLYRRPQILPKLAFPALFFVPLHLAHEYTGLMLGQWVFPGTYMGTVYLKGAGTLPLEEFFIWILVGSVIVTAYHELYIDDGK